MRRNNRQDRLKRLADRIYEACLVIDPTRLWNLLGGVPVDDKDVLVGILEGRHTFQMVSLVGNIFRDYGQWADTMLPYRRRRDVLRIAALLDRYLGVRPIFGMGLDIAQDLREDIMYADNGDTEEDILVGRRCDLVSEGVRDIDIDLFIAFCRLDYDMVRDLLDRGADPEAVVSEGHSAACLARWNVDLTIQEIWDLLSGERKALKGTDTFDLIELGAYDTMLRLFSRGQRGSSSVPGNGLQTDEVLVPQFVLDLPELGWCDVHFLAGGRTMMEIGISDVCEPFPEILGWCRGLTDAVGPLSLEIDCGRFTAVMSYSPLESEPGTGIFSVSDDSGAGDGFSVKVLLHDLVNNLVSAISDYRSELLKWYPGGRSFSRLCSLDYGDILAVLLSYDLQHCFRKNDV